MYQRQCIFHKTVFFEYITHVHTFLYLLKFSRFQLLSMLLPFSFLEIGKCYQILDRRYLSKLSTFRIRVKNFLISYFFFQMDILGGYIVYLASYNSLLQTESLKKRSLYIDALIYYLCVLTLFAFSFSYLFQAFLFHHFS